MFFGVLREIFLRKINRREKYILPCGLLLHHYRKKLLQFLVAVDCASSELFLNAEKLVVFCHAVSAAH